MQQDEITKLIIYVEENTRAAQASGLEFVDTRHFLERLSSKQNHIVYGRRGAGKTTLVKSIQNSPRHLDIYINMEDFKDITFPNIVIHVLLELFQSLNDQINDAYPWYKFSNKSRSIKRRVREYCSSLLEYLYEPDTETQEISTRDSIQDGMSAGVSAKGVSGSVSTQSFTSREVKRTLPKNKLDFLRIELTNYKKLLNDISSLFSSKPIFLLLDDFYFVQKKIQPYLVDYFHRITKGTDLYLKLATIKYRTKLYRRTDDDITGIEVPHDISEIDMDYTLTNFEELQVFMRELLTKAISGSQASVKFDELFAGDGFSQLCLASGGVPRDFLSLFVSLNRTFLSNQPIGKMDVNDAAISNYSNKLSSMKRDSGSEDTILEYYLLRIKQIVYREKRTNVFLISKDELEKETQLKQAIRELIDLRFVYPVDENTSKAPSDGKRYEAYMLDICLYDNSRPRNFNQIEPGYRDAKSRMDELRASPVINLDLLNKTEIFTQTEIDLPSTKESQPIGNQGKLDLSFDD